MNFMDKNPMMNQGKSPYIDEDCYACLEEFTQQNPPLILLCHHWVCVQCLMLGGDCEKGFREMDVYQIYQFVTQKYNCHLCTIC